MYMNWSNILEYFICNDYIDVGNYIFIHCLCNFKNDLIKNKENIINKIKKEINNWKNRILLFFKYRNFY